MTIDHCKRMTFFMKKEAGAYASISCGPASLKSLLSFFDLSLPPLEEWVKELMHKGVLNEQKGFLWNDSVHFLEDLGLEVKFWSRFDLNDLKNALLDSPLLLSIQAKEGGHVVVLCGFGDNSFTIYDPEDGALRTLSYDELESRLNPRTLILKKRTL